MAFPASLFVRDRRLTAACCCRLKHHAEEAAPRGEILPGARFPAGWKKAKPTWRSRRLTCQYFASGVLLYHPPLFQGLRRAGTLRLEADAASMATMRRRRGQTPRRIIAATACAAAAIRPWMDRTITMGRNPPRRSWWTASGKIPGRRAQKCCRSEPAFSAFGPSLFFVSELTAENHATALEFNYQRDKKEGSK